MKKKPAKASHPKAKKKKPAVKREGQDKFSLKRLLMGEEKPDLTELESGSTTILDILSPTAVDTKSRDYIVVDGVFHAYLYVTGYGYATTVGSCWLAPLVEAGVNLSFIFKRQPKDKILSKIAQTTMVNRSPVFLDPYDDYKQLLDRRVLRRGQDLHPPVSGRTAPAAGAAGYFHCAEKGA